MTDIPAGWTLAPLMEIVDLHDSRRVPLNQQQRAGRQGPFPYYGANGQVDSINEYIFEGDYVLLAEDGGYFDDPARGVAYEVSGKFWVNNHAHVVSPRNGIPTRYLTYALNQLDWMPYVGGSTRLKLTQEGMRRVRIPLAPPQVQLSIIAKLDTLLAPSRKAREELSRIPRLVERYKRAILAAACSGDLTTDWRKERDLQEPTWAVLDTLLAVPIRNGLSIRGSDEPPGVRSLRLSALRTGVVDLDDIRYLPITEGKADKFLLCDGDVLVSRGNGTKSFVGIAAIVQRVTQPTIFPDTAFRIRLATDRARADWFTAIWNAPQVRTQIESAAKTTAGIWKVSQGDLARIQLLLPHVDEQDEIARRTRAAFGRIETVAAETSRATDFLDRLEKATLGKAFRGELVSSAMAGPQ